MLSSVPTKSQGTPSCMEDCLPSVSSSNSDMDKIDLGLEAPYGSNCLGSIWMLTGGFRPKLDVISGMSVSDMDEDKIGDAVAACFQDWEDNSTICAQEAEVCALLGLGSRYVEINKERYIRESDVQHEVQGINHDNECRIRSLHHGHALRVVDLEREISQLREQLGLWRKLAVTVVEGVDQDVQRWMEHLNDAVLWGIDETDIPDKVSTSEISDHEL
ncbi:hypothetical protein AAF712_016280 [Marasmius tenuissimus]|uniref:Uncharacterized protein n=1 Tax=Marasmius tenuissimus TaxID=585030 RepID=A0ABR2Z8I3_9AGAR|nr:hypothetical protein PM082_024853 [Marasmius tenuissimus]